MSKNAVINLLNLPLYCQVTLSLGEMPRSGRGGLHIKQNPFTYISNEWPESHEKDYT